MIRDQLFLFFANCEFNKYPSCSVTKRKSVSFIEKLELIIDIRDFITYFFSWFSVSRPFRKMRFWKCQMRMMRFGNCYLHLSFPFRHFQAFLSDTFLAPLLFALEQDEKPYFHAYIVTRFGLQLDLLQVDLFARFEYTANRKWKW